MKNFGLQPFRPLAAVAECDKSFATAIDVWPSVEPCCDEFYIPTPDNLKAYEIPRRLFEPILRAYSRYSLEDQTKSLKYFKCFLKGISELSNTTFTSTMKKELMDISIGYSNVELTNVLANDENFRPLFESKDDLGRTFIQEYLYRSRFSVVSFHLCTLQAKKCNFSSGCGT